MNSIYSLYGVSYTATSLRHQFLQGMYDQRSFGVVEVEINVGLADVSSYVAVCFRTSDEIACMMYTLPVATCRERLSVRA